MQRTAAPSLVSLIRQADREARRRFTYEYDPPRRDTWVSHAEDVRQGQSWSGDCDDLGSTALELAVEMGADPAALYRARVASPVCPPSQPFDHYVALAEDASSWWVFGDTFAPAQRLNQSGHQVHSSACVSDGLHSWRLW